MVQVKQAIKREQPVTPEKKGFSAWAIIGFIFLGLFIVGVLLVGLALVGFIASISSTQDTSMALSGNVAFIKIDDVITTQSSESIFGESSGVSSTTVVERLQEIKDDSSIKGVIFEINSPGGSGVASDEIAQAIQSLNKPTVSYIREVGASGAYWIASSTDHIYANRFSIVGSIGVIASYLDFSEFIKEWNVSYERFVAGDKKDFGSPFRELTPAERSLFQKQLDQMHTFFIEEVAEGRNLDPAYVRTLADGFVYTGQDSVDKKLVDGIGGKQDAIAYMSSKIGEDVELVTYDQPEGFFDLLMGYHIQGMKQMGVGLGEVLVNSENKAMTIKT